MLDFLTMALAGWDNPLLTVFATFLDNDWFFLVLMLLVAFTGERGKKRNFLLLTLAVVFLAGVSLKFAVQETRPCLIVPSKVQCPSGYAFPSNHAMVAFALVMALWKKPGGWIMLLAAVFIAFTRIYLGVHTLLDVSGGAVLGALLYLAMGEAWRMAPEKIKSPLSEWLEA